MLADLHARRSGRETMADDRKHDREGNAARFRALALPLMDDVYTLARYLLHSAADAEDAVQECYLRAFRYFDTFSGSTMKPWLFQILRNVCRGMRGTSEPLVYGEAGSAANGAAEHPLWSKAPESPESAMIRSQDAITLRGMIQSLPAEFREVLVLREVNELSYREIAQVIEAPVGTVMSRLARARALLREAWVAAEGGTGT
jgi:RNA polymerase sigma-70 factor, ECF subfamily